MTTNHRNVSVIIPCYNEQKRIEPIIEEIKKSPFVKEIIVVDDGSDYVTKQILYSINEIKIVTHNNNKGKSESLLTGVNYATMEIILFVDSDLIGFKSHHVNDLITTFLNGRYDMVLGDRDREVWLLRLLGLTISQTGERIFYRNCLLKHKKDIFKSGYLFEPASSKLFFNIYRVGKVVLKGVGQTNKVKKNGIFGLINDLKMQVEYLKFLGVRDYFYQGYFAKRL